MNVEDIKKENHINIQHGELKFDLDNNYITDCKLMGKGWNEKDDCFTIQAIDISIKSLIESYHYGNKKEYEQDLKTIKK